MPYIKNIFAREVIDARGIPALEVEVYTQCGACGSAIVPSGASAGIYEALELRDMQGKRYMGQGVLKAAEHVNTVLKKALTGMCVLEQMEIDQAMLELDGTDNKGNLGGNAILGVSMACARAGAACASLPLYRYLGGCFAHVLPVPQIHMICGRGRAGKGPGFSDFMIMPSGAEDFKEQVRMGCEIFGSLGRILEMDGYGTAVGDFGGFMPELTSNEKALSYIVKAICEAGYQPGRDVTLALGVSASRLWNNGKYRFSDKETMEMDAQELIDYYEYLCSRFPLRSIEDGLDQDDWDGWCELTQRLGKNVTIAGDDFFAGNASRLKMGAQKQAGNALVLKLSQIGTVSEAQCTAETARRLGYAVIVSERRGESEDSMIADFAVAVNAGQIKAGGVCRADHTAKYNRLLKIYDELGRARDFARNLYC